MFRQKLTTRILRIIGLTMFAGFSALGIISIWLEFNSIINLHVDNAKKLGTIIMHDIDEYMMKGDSRELARYIDEIRDNGSVRDLRIFSDTGKPVGDEAAEANPLVMQAFTRGVPMELRQKENGVHSWSPSSPSETRNAANSATTTRPSIPAPSS
jgi:methyl-accepting chemotaxis protein